MPSWSRPPKTEKSQWTRQLTSDERVSPAETRTISRGTLPTLPTLREGSPVHSSSLGARGCGGQCDTPAPSLIRSQAKLVPSAWTGQGTPATLKSLSEKTRGWQRSLEHHGLARDLTALSRASL